MTKATGVAVLAAGLLLASGLSAQSAALPPNEGVRTNGQVRLAQMNSPGDGLTPGSEYTGNGRPRTHGHHGHHHHYHGHYTRGHDHHYGYRNWRHHRRGH